MHLSKYIVLEDIRFYWEATGSWYMLSCSIHIPLRLCGYDTEGKLNIYVLAKHFILFYSIWFDLFTFEHFIFRKFIFLYDIENMWKSCKNSIFDKLWVCMSPCVFNTVKCCFCLMYMYQYLNQSYTCGTACCITR